MKLKPNVFSVIANTVSKIVYWALQPLLIVISLYLANINAAVELHIVFVIGAFCLITVLEVFIPARSEWKKSLGENAALLGFVLVAGTAYALIETLYTVSLFSWMTSLGAAWQVNIWPSHWPIVAQVLLIFVAFEFINYWYHRASHRWSLLWRVSGHSAHHAFKKLSGLNALANHPVEAFFLILPRAIVGFLLGGEAVGSAFVSLSAVTAIIVHSNLNLNSAVVGWFFTTNRYHIHHHSQVISESNTNYGCVCIVWDRIFGTFQDADTKNTGIGDHQPSYKAMYLMPFKK